MPSIELVAGTHIPNVKWWQTENSYGSNSYLVRAGHTLYIIESGLGGLHRSQLSAAIAKFSNVGKVYLLNTHWHLDHSGNSMILEELGRRFPEVHYFVPEIAKQNMQTFMESTAASVEVDLGLSKAEWLREADKQDFYLGGLLFHGWKAEEAYLLSTPGHTADSLSIYFEGEKAIFTGDVLWYVNPNSVEGSIREVLQSTAKVKDLVQEEGVDYLGVGHFNPIEGKQKIIAYITDYEEKERALVSRLEEVVAASDRVSLEHCLDRLRESDHPAIKEALSINYPYSPSYLHRFIRVFFREKGWHEVDKEAGGTWSPKHPPNHASL